MRTIHAFFFLNALHTNHHKNTPAPLQKKTTTTTTTTIQVVLSCTQDDFFARHRNANFGDLGVAVKGKGVRGWVGTCL